MEKIEKIESKIKEQSGKDRVFVQSNDEWYQISLPKYGRVELNIRDEKIVTGNESNHIKF